MYRAEAFSPGHITGFFEVCDSEADPLKRGSRGAGFSISHGVRTSVAIEPSGKNERIVYFDGKRTNEASVTEKTIELFFRNQGIKQPYSVTVMHELEIPLGAGFGTSGAGALGCALCLNSALGTRLTYIEASRIAHIAEIESGTGLGTVSGEMAGGFEMRLSPGAPGICRIKRFSKEKRYKCVSLTFGPLSTKKLLSEKQLRETINKTGSALTDRLAKKPSIRLFMELSREFAENTGLLPSAVIGILSVLDRRGILASMPMFGNGIFALVPENLAFKTSRMLEEFQAGGRILISSIEAKGAHTLK